MPSSAHHRKIPSEIKSAGQDDRSSSRGGGKTSALLSSERKNQSETSFSDSFRQLFGFRLEELTSHNDFVRLLNRPCDPAALGVLRFIFGLLMFLDIFHERGLHMLDRIWGSEKACQFPLFDVLKPLPLPWMYVIYLVMLIGALGIMLGFKFRISCVMFMGPYWYIFMLNKLTWNNHSYLYGVVVFLFLFTSANRYWSIDGLLNPAINNTHVPLWNYTLLRAQVFIVYFIAGLKKLDVDWVSGYSMQNLSGHWVFDPFKFVLTDSQIDLYIVHLGGLTIDLFIGYLLFFDKTRILGLIISTSFNTMNAAMFSIGMFPYAMLGFQTVFCSFHWPRRIFNKIPSSIRLFTPDNTVIRPSNNCLYTKQDAKSEEVHIALTSPKSPHDMKVLPTTASVRQKVCAWLTVCFIAWQCFLPYSHGITKGFNNWTNGLYGYSWDMMIHNWSMQHIRIMYLDKKTGDTGFLDPSVWGGSNSRWSSHGDTIKQYSQCVAQNLKDYGVKDVEIYLDIWKSINQRFQQRMVDPRVNILTAPWQPFESTPWVMPLLTELSDWRAKLTEIEHSLSNETGTEPDIVFVADFPDLFLENYVHEDFGNTTLSVLHGRVIVELMDTKKNISLAPGHSLQIPPGSFHNVHTVSHTPSCYFYTFVNTTEVTFNARYAQFNQDFNSYGENETMNKYKNDPNLNLYLEIFKDKTSLENGGQKQTGFLESFHSFFVKRFQRSTRSLHFMAGAIKSIITNSSFQDFLNATYTNDIEPEPKAKRQNHHV